MNKGENMFRRNKKPAQPKHVHDFPGWTNHYMVYRDKRGQRVGLSSEVWFQQRQCTDPQCALVQKRYP